MRYRTRELGVVEVAKDKVLCFTAPLLGFESFRKFALLPAPGASPFFVLQSLEEPQLAFPVVRSEEMPLAYHGRACASLLSAGDLRRITAATADEVACWIIVALPTDGSPLRLNLRAPVIVNEKKQLAAQVVIGEEYAPGARLGDVGVERTRDEPLALAEDARLSGHSISQSTSVATE